MMESTQLKRLELFRDRWSSFGSETGIILLSEKLSAQDLKGIEIFRGLDDRFLEQLTPDLTIAQWRENSILFEEGSYIDLAFLVLKGEVEVYLNRHQGERTVVQPIYAKAQREDELEAGSGADDSIYTERSQKRVARREPSFLANVDFDLPTGDKLILGLGEIFGEIGALNGWPMKVPARTRSNCTLLQIRLPALRLLKRKSKSFKEQIDRVYRERSLLGHLRVAPLFRGCEDSFLDDLAESLDLISSEPHEIVAEQGEPADALYLVRSGFFKTSQKTGAGQRAVSYVSKGGVFW